MYIVIWLRILLISCSKTQIAIEYCYRFREKNPHAQVFWVHLGTITKFSQGCKTITRRLELPGWDDPQTNNLQQFYDWLNNDKNGQWLLVLDNVDEITFLETPLQLQNNSVRINEFISRSALGAILITTRDKMIGERLAVRGRTVEVLTMAMKEARQLVNFRLSTLPTTEASDREDLIKELNYLPLGITQATAYIIEKCITVKQYLSIFHDGDEEMLELLSENISDDRRIDQESHSVFRTWKLSYDQITKQNPRAAEILSLMSMLDRQEIPSSVIKKDGESTRVFLSAIAVLQNFSLVSKSANGENYGMHRLVQFSTRAWLKVQGAAFNWKSEALFILASKFPSGEFETWRACESLLPHVRLILQEELNGDDYYLKRAELLKKVAWFDRLQGRYEIAISEIQEAHDIFVRLYDNEHSEALSCLTTKADCLIENDDYSIAEGLLRDISVTQERILGPFHPESLRTAGNLAYALYALGIYQESEELHRKTLIGRERELGSRHASTLMSMNNLALVLEARGKLSETEDLHRKTLALREKVHGVDHPLVLESQHNLAFVLHNQNKLSEAEDMCRKTLASQEQVLGLDHPNTLRSRFTLASILNDCGKYEEAEELHRSLIVSGEKNLGSSRFATILNNAAACLSHQSKHQEAEELGRRSLSLWEQTRGINHVETANTRYSVAYFLFVQGKIKEAAQLYRDVLAMKGNVEESKDGIRWESLMKGAKRELENCIKQLSSISNEEIPLSDETTADNFSHDDNDKGLDQDSSTVLPLRRDRN